MRIAHDYGSVRSAKVGYVMLALAVGLVGCANVVPPSNARSNAKLTPNTGISRDLNQLPRPKARIPVAVYGFRDQTGQFKTSPESSYSTLVTQGAAAILVKALEDSGWYTAVEREGLQNLLTERRIIRAIESPAEKGKPVINLPNMMPASILIEGGVIGYESNVRTGGKGANYLGIGASTQYRVDQVTVSLRSVDVRYGQVLNSVSVTKTIYSYQFSASVFKYTSYQNLLQGETGYATNEPAQLAVREAIEAAVVHLTVNGIRDRYFELQNASDWFSPVIQTYMAEALGNIGEAPLGEDAVIPMRPISAQREPVRPMPFNFETVPPARPRDSGEAVVDKSATASALPKASPVAASSPAQAPAMAAPTSVVAAAVSKSPSPANKPTTVPTRMPAAASAATSAFAPAPLASANAVAAPPPAKASPSSSKSVSTVKDSAAIAPRAVAPVLVKAAGEDSKPTATALSAQTLPGTAPLVSPAQRSINTPAMAQPTALPASGNVGQPEGRKPAVKEDIFNLYWNNR